MEPVDRPHDETQSRSRLNPNEDLEKPAGFSPIVPVWVEADAGAEFRQSCIVGNSARDASADGSTLALMRFTGRLFLNSR